MNTIRKQIGYLYTSSVLGNLSLTGAWVAILAARGYSLVEIGFVETVFHVTSIIFEIPSGIFADVFGRKNMLIVSSILRMIANVVMIASGNLFTICLSIALHAMSYNFSSGSGDALAYDSLKIYGEESYYAKYESDQLSIYRLCNGISTLCAGFALYIGYRAAYGTDILMCLVQIFVLNRIWEHREHRDHKANTIVRALVDCWWESIQFLKDARRAIVLMLVNSLVGAGDILLLFFLQAKLPESGISNALLGMALFIMELGGILGARVILLCDRLRYRTVFVLTGFLVLLGIAVEHSGNYVIMTLGGFIAAFSDDALQVRTNTILQNMFPSEQRATLISMESFTFSMIMIVLSPLTGILFSWW